jgi:outer membrane protein OmpA-like peptidoglycan-associated protein/tetratricopeptide (TPR) repeat protein
MSLNNINTFFSFLLCLILHSLSFSQECELEVPKSIEKIYLKGKNYKKYDYKNRVKFFKEALEIEEDCIPCIWELAKMSFRRKYTSGDPMDFPKKYFLKLESLCPTYHADVFYYLSLIYYMEKNDCEAVVYFEKFLKFPTENKKQIAINYKDQKQYVEASLEMSKYYCDFYSNPVPFEPKVLTNISTAERNEILPVISPDNEHIYYTIEYDEFVKGDFAVHHEQVLANSTRLNFKDFFEKGIPLEEPFNQGPKYGGATISLNNKEMFICACIQNGGYFNCDIYKSQNERKTITLKKEGKDYDTTFYSWSPLENLGPNINGPQTWEAQPSLSGDGNTLYFASARPGGYGKIDIYYSKRQEDGSWSKAKNMGKPINTSQSDKSPFIHTDSRTFYFVSESSDYRWGAGDFDIFYTQQNEETLLWDEPKNIGYPINSEEPEESLIVSVDGHFGYFSSKRKEGLGGKDIFYFEIPEEAKPDKIVLAKGKGSFEDSETKNTKMILRDENGNKKEQHFSLSDDGDFVAIVNVEDVTGDALLEIQTDNGAFESLLISKDDVESTVIKQKEIDVQLIEKGQSYTINDILFESNSSKLKESSKIVLDGFSDWLIKNQKLNIEIQGHTDDVGPNKANLALSMDRSFSVMEYLLEKGISKERLSFKGYGETKPKVPNNSSKLRMINRRTDFLIF